MKKNELLFYLVSFQISIIHAQECRFVGGTLETMWSVSNSSLSFTSKAWKFQSSTVSETTIMSLILGTFSIHDDYVGRLERSPPLYDSGMVLRDILSSDDGLYWVEVSDSADLIYTQSTTLNVITDEPADICKVNIGGKSVTCDKGIGASARGSQTRWGVICNNGDGCTPSAGITITLKSSGDKLSSENCSQNTECLMNVNVEDTQRCVSLNYTVDKKEYVCECVCLAKDEKVLHTVVSSVLGTFLTLAAVLTVVFTKLIEKTKCMILGLGLGADILIFLIPIIVHVVSLNCSDMIVIIVDVVFLVACMTGIGITWGLSICSKK